jgi:anti-anti-sigma factor
LSAVGTSRVLRPDPASLDRREHHHRAVFSACHLSDTTVLVTVRGEVDATNSRALAGYVERQIAGWGRLVLDLSTIDFFGTAGFAALHNVNVTCARYDVQWVLVVGPQLNRFLQIFDPDHLLPAEDSAAVH